VIAGAQGGIKARQLEGKGRSTEWMHGTVQQRATGAHDSKSQKDILFSEIKPEMAATVVEQVVVPVFGGQED